MRSVTVLIAIVATLATVRLADAEPMSYLDNGLIRLGVDLGKGGTITYLSSSGADVNVVNSFDLGRQVQQSYYSGPENFGNPGGDWPNWPWNPEGAGDTFGNPAPVLEQSNEGLTIYTKTAPLQWALARVPCECLIEQWITLDGNSVHVRNRLTNYRSDHTEYEAYGQELPAAYTNGTFWRLFTYGGNSPYTGGPLTQIINAGPPWAQFSATEHWAALVNDSGFGLGVFNAFVTNFIGGFSGTPNIGGPSDDPTGYIAPSILEILDWNIVYEYDYSLLLGTLDQIRAYAVVHRPDDRFDYQFARDRQHFWLFNATDAGWPVNGALHVNLNQNDPYIIGPEQWWQAQDVPRLYITAAYHTSGTNAQLFWSVPGQGFAQGRSMFFAAIPDGQYHTYTVDLASSPAYQGTITGIRFDPSDGNDASGYVDIASIASKPPSADLAISKSDSPDPVIAGSNLTYTITVTNNGPSAATGVTMTDALRGTLTFVSATPSQGTCTSSIVCSLGVLSNGSSAIITIVVTPTQVGGISNTATVTANEPDPDTSNNSATQVTTINAVTGQLTLLSPAKLWLGQAGRSKTLKFDLLVEVLVNGSVVGTGQLSNVKAGGSTFSGAVLDTVLLTLGAPTAAPTGTGLSIRASVRISCSITSTGVSGTARLWYNGQPIDTGRRKDAGSRFDATIGGVNSNYYLRPAFTLATSAGTSRQSIDVAVNSSVACPVRSFTPFATWNITFQ